MVEESLRIAESQRSNIYDPQLRTSYFASVHDYSQLHIDLLMSLHKAEPARGLDALAVESSERARARGLLELLTEAGADIRQGVDAALLERERLLIKQLNDKTQRLTQIIDPQQVAALKLEVSELETNLERAQTDIRKVSPHYASLTQPQPLKLKEIQEQLMPIHYCSNIR